MTLKLLILPVLLASLLSGCIGVPDYTHPDANSGAAATADIRVETLAARYRAARIVIDAVLIVLPQPLAAKVRAIETAIDLNIAQARMAATSAARAAALADAKAQLDHLQGTR